MKPNHHEQTFITVHNDKTHQVGKEPCAASAHAGADYTQAPGNRDIPEGATPPIRTVPVDPDYLPVSQVY